MIALVLLALLALLALLWLPALYVWHPDYRSADPAPCELDDDLMDGPKTIDELRAVYDYRWNPWAPVVEIHTSARDPYNPVPVPDERTAPTLEQNRRSNLPDVRFVPFTGFTRED